MMPVQDFFTVWKLFRSFQTVKKSCIIRPCFVTTHRNTEYTDYNECKLGFAFAVYTRNFIVNVNSFSNSEIGTQKVPTLVSRGLMFQKNSDYMKILLEYWFSQHQTIHQPAPVPQMSTAAITLLLLLLFAERWHAYIYHTGNMPQEFLMVSPYT